MPIYEHAGVAPKIGDGVYVAPTATVIGDVTIGDQSSLWFGAVLRGDCYPIRVGARSNIQDGSVIHVTGGYAGTVVGDDVTIGHMVLLHGCTIGDRSLVGMGSVVLDAAVIGEGSLLGAGSLVPPRAVIPPGVLAIGRPAKVIRPLQPDDVARIREAGEHYLRYAQTFRTAVRRIDV